MSSRSKRTKEWVMATKKYPIAVEVTYVNGVPSDYLSVFETVSDEYASVYVNANVPVKSVLRSLRGKVEKKIKTKRLLQRPETPLDKLERAFRELEDEQEDEQEGEEDELKE